MLTLARHFRYYFMGDFTIDGVGLAEQRRFDRWVLAIGTNVHSLQQVSFTMYFDPDPATVYFGFGANGPSHREGMLAVDVSITTRDGRIIVSSVKARGLTDKHFAAWLEQDLEIAVQSRMFSRRARVRLLNPRLSAHE